MTKESAEENLRDIAMEATSSSEESAGSAVKKQPYVVFTTSSQYHWATTMMIALSIGICCFTAIPVMLDETASTQEKMQVAKAIIFSTIAVGIIFMLVLPKSIQVRSDASIGVTTFSFITYSFGRTARAYRSGLWHDTVRRPKFKFGTDIVNRVVVVRKNGGWDLIVSPRNVDGFLDAVNSVTQEQEEQEGEMV